MSEVISLDEHRLLCGNAQVKEDVDKLLDGVKVDLLLTDPPYGINIVNPVGGGKSVDKVEQVCDRSVTHTHTHTKWHNRRSETTNLQEEQWEHQQDQGSTRERERERANGKVGKPRRC